MFLTKVKDKNKSVTILVTVDNKLRDVIVLEEAGITPSSSIRDYLDSKEIICLKAVEYLACQFIDMKDVNPCDAIKQAIELSLTTKRFASKYNSLLPQLASIK